MNIVHMRNQVDLALLAHEHARVALRGRKPELLQDIREVREPSLRSRSPAVDILGEPPAPTFFSPTVRRQRVDELLLSCVHECRRDVRVRDGPSVVHRKHVNDSSAHRRRRGCEEVVGLVCRNFLQHPPASHRRLPRIVLRQVLPT